MASTADDATSGHASFLTDQDEIGLAETVARQTEESQPDTLVVKSDAVAVMQGVMAPIRRPAAKAVALVGIAVVAIVGVGILSRVMRHGAATPVPQ